MTEPGPSVPLAFTPGAIPDAVRSVHFARLRRLFDVKGAAAASRRCRWLLLAVSA